MRVRCGPRRGSRGKSVAVKRACGSRPGRFQRSPTVALSPCTREMSVLGEAALVALSSGGVMPTSPPLDSPASRRPSVPGPGGQARRRPSNRGRHFPADPPRTEEVIAVMRCCDESDHGARARALIVILWRAGLRIQEALDLNELDLDRRCGSVLVRRGKAATDARS